MEPDELYAKIKQHPFEPLRIHVSDGKAYEIKHPEQIRVGRRSSHIGSGGNGEGSLGAVCTQR